MPVTSTCLYIKTLLAQLPMPGGLPNLAAYITPMDPNVDSQYPTAYVWPTDWDESRTGEHGGTIPRNSGPGTVSGIKPIEHSIDIYIVYFMPDDAPLADSLFTGIVDAVTAQLRTSEDPAPVTDPFTGTQSVLIDVGEVMKGRIVVSATSDQAWNRYDALLTCTVHELIRA